METFAGRKLTNEIASLRAGGIAGDWLDDLKDIRSYIASQAQGRDVDLRTPFFGGIGRPRIIEKWDSIFEPAATSLDGELVNYERDERDKIGALSRRVPYSERIEGVQHYYNVKSQFPSTLEFGTLRIASEMVRNLEARRSLSTINIGDAVDSLPKSTNWGLPFFEKGSDSWERYLERAAKLDRSIRRGEGPNIDSSVPSLLGWRGAAQGLYLPSKSRVIWIFPHEVSILERRFQFPLTARLKRHNALAAWTSDEKVDGAVNRILQSPSEDFILSFDASRFDTTITGQFIDIVFDIIRSWFQPEDEKLILWLADYFRTGSLVVPAGNSGRWVIKGSRVGSVPSGSTFTNLVDSLANMILSCYVKLRSGEDRSQVEYDLSNRNQTQGDDAIWTFNNMGYDNVIKNLIDIGSYVAECGLTANPLKQYAFPGKASYLRNLHSKEKTGGVRSTYRLFSGLTGYERFRNDWTSKEDSARWIMQINNCRNHPLFRELIKFCIQGDEKHALGTKTPQGLEAIFSGKEESLINRLGLQSFGTGRDQLLGWRQLPVVRVLREIAAQ